MKRKLKITAVIFIISCIIVSLFGCTNKDNNSNNKAENDSSYSEENSDNFTGYYSASDYQVDEVFYLGSYPQSQVTDVRLIAELDQQNFEMTSYNYDDITFYYGDLEYDGSKYRRVYWTRDSSEFNSFEQDTNYYFLWEPMEWKIVGDLNDEWQVFANYVYDVKAMSDEGETWDKTYCREWLNNTFLNDAFDDYDQSIIKSTDTSGSDYSSEDQLFLLSFDDITNGLYGFKGIDPDGLYEDSVYEDSNRVTTATDYATFFASENIYDDSYCEYFLRDLTHGTGYSGEDSYYNVEYSDGDVNHQVGYNSCGIRPAFRISKDAKIPY